MSTKGDAQVAISLDTLRKSGQPRSPILVTYGVSGIGKTTLACSFPNPVVICTEDGLGTIQVDSFPKEDMATFADVLGALTVLATEDHKFETLVVDSLDWLEPLIWAQACKDHDWADIEAPGYGKGYVAALAYWREYIDAITYLRDRGMTIVQTAHSQIKKFDNPETESYDRYDIKLHKAANAIVQEHSDGVFFANYKVATTSADQGFNKKKVRAIGQGDRVLYCQERPSALAKNRYGMPLELPMEWTAIAEYIPFFTPAEKEAA